MKETIALSLVVNLALILFGSSAASSSGSLSDNDPKVMATCSSSDGGHGVTSSCSGNYVEKSATADNMETESAEHCSSKAEAKPPNSNALVLYNPTHLEPFQLTSRTFHFARRDFSIKQNWADYGVAAVVWDAAIVLCEYLESQCKTGDLVLDGMRVIELGAGTGIVGMVAAALDGETTITDREQVLNPLRENVALNFPSTPTELPSESSSPVVKALTWGKNLHEFPTNFDLILGADVVYIEDTFPDLLQTLAHLSNSDSLVLLSCRIRYDRDKDFLSMLREKFSVTEVVQDTKRGIVIYSATKLTS